MPAISTEEFTNEVWAYYASHRRAMPWRTDPSPYSVVVSEIMLQQTRVERVIPKFEIFLKRFPDFEILAAVPLDEVLRTWAGLGYNRRAKYLHLLARQVVNEHHGTLPRSLDELVALPGIGRQTAGAILAYAYNQPAVFVETNIRTVYLHHFFPDLTEVNDTEVLPIVARTVDANRPREWYWALMDYGTMLKKTVGNHAKRSRHYVRQSAFSGSVRQLRGRVIKILLDGPLTKKELTRLIDDMRLNTVIEQLAREGLVSLDGIRVQLKGR